MYCFSITVWTTVRLASLRARSNFERIFLWLYNWKFAERLYSRKNWTPNLYGTVFGFMCYSEFVHASCSTIILDLVYYSTFNGIFCGNLLSRILFVKFYVDIHCYLYAQGCVFPSAHSLIAKWSPPNERSKFIGGLTGGSLGTAVTWPMCGMIIEAIGWQYVFYVTGALCMLFSLSWIVFVYDSPAKHPRITKAEREYIEGELVGLSDSAKVFS